jgi:hypothetical protein
MTIIQVPADVAVSPEDGSTISLNTDTGTFNDKSGNQLRVADLAASRPANAIKKWLNENYPGDFTRWWKSIEGE